MGQMIAFTTPVQPGASDRVRNFEQEIQPHLTEFERLNKEATVTRFSVWLQETPIGDFAIFVMEADDPSRLRQRFTDSDYDKWWLGWFKAVVGLDLAATPDPPVPPPVAYDWKG